MVGISLSVGMAQGFSAALKAAPPAQPQGPAVRHLVFLGQSEPHRLFLSGHADVALAAPVTDPAALEIWWYDLDTGTPNRATGVQRDAITDTNPVSRWAVEMSNTLAALAPGVAFKMACLLYAGTGLADLLDDARVTAGRHWTQTAPNHGDREVYDRFIAETGIAQPDAAFMAWENTDSTLIQFEIGDAWWVALTGTGLNDGATIAAGTQRHNVNFDHFLTELWDTSTVPFGFLMHRFDVFPGARLDWERFRDVRVSLDRMVASSRNQARNLPFFRGIDPNAYANGYDIGDDSHPRKSDDGAAKDAQQLAFNMARMTGTPLPAPRIDHVIWTPETVKLSSNAGHLTTTRLLRLIPLPPEQPKIAQLYFRTAEAPEVLFDIPDEAITIEEGIIVITAAAALAATGAERSVFLRGDRIEFASGPAGANDAQDKTDASWLDYPGLAQAALELVPLQPVCGVMICDIPAIAAPINLLQDFDLWATAQGGLDQGGGWYVLPANSAFDSQVAGHMNLCGLISPSEYATVIVDLDRQLGLTAQNATQINFRDIAGIGHQRIVIQNIWGEVAQNVPTVMPQAFGWMPLPDGRVRIWAQVQTTAQGRHVLYLNSANSGGAWGFAGLYNGILPIAVIAGL